MMWNSETAERTAVLQTAQQMMAAIRTAPKGCGMDNVVSLALDGQDKDHLADEMQKIHAETGLEFFQRDAGNIRACDMVVLVGVKDHPLGMPHCGICGFADCRENRAAHGRCAFNLTDLGVALGSAVSIAAQNRVDSRIFYSAGRAALRLSLLGDEVKNLYAVGLSVTSKSIFFDRGPRKIMV